ncbi:MAG: type I methionyl aminopeptidase, partial [Vulcanimicrobiaceae bacterium]
MITIKSAREIEIMRRGGKVTAAVLTQLVTAARPGVTTRELDRLAERLIRTAGGEPTFKGYNGFPWSICASINEQVVHGMPDQRPMRDGDILSIDIGSTFEGYVTDTAITIPIGQVSEEAQRLMRVTQECLMLGIAQMQLGSRLSDIGHAVQVHAERHGYGVVRDLVGHGVGTKMHEEPQVPNYGKRGQGIVLRAGLCLAIEPMITAGTHEVETQADGWTVITADGKLAAHFEHTVALTDDGPKILTLRDILEHPDAAHYRPAAD